jgi:glycosyltransferase involved in cell wall biosynthesis
MLRFADLLVHIYACAGQVVLLFPPVFFSRLPALPASVRKYFAYIDKLLLFPLWLSIRSRSFDRIHIADHSNAFYTFFCPHGRCVVTCHDLLAMRGAMGDITSACTASPIGIWLQRLIMAGLRRADAIAFDSHATFLDFQRIIGSIAHQRHEVIPIPLNAAFIADKDAFPLTALEQGLIPSNPFLLMVGSSLPRKNRALALQLLERLGSASPFSMVFAGAPLTEQETMFQSTHPLGRRLISIVGPSHGLLNRLYCQAHALLFPSFAEGFGWPLVEAQTCCCPVIASPTTSIPEVAGQGALYADPTDVAGFAAHVRSLEDCSIRHRLIHLGLKNIRRYDIDVVAMAYRRFAFQSSR